VVPTWSRRAEGTQVTGREHPRVTMHSKRELETPSNVKTSGWALRDSNPRPQPCESDFGPRSGRFPTTRDASTRDDQDWRSDLTVAEVRSCGAFCGARIRTARCRSVRPTLPSRQSVALVLTPVIAQEPVSFQDGEREVTHGREWRDTGLATRGHCEVAQTYPVILRTRRRAIRSNATRCIGASNFQ
jgi:hypothetical protein